MEPEEAVAVGEHVAGCAECAEALAEMRALVGALPLTVPQVAPPPELKERVLRSVQPSRETARPTAESPRHRWSLRGPAALAAAATLFVALAGVLSWGLILQDRLDENQERVSSLYDAMTVLADADQRWEFSGSVIEPGARGVLAYSAERQASMLMVWGLPEQDEDSTYNAWAASGGSREGMGSMRRANDGLWAMVPGDITDMESVGITLREDDGPGGEETMDVIVISLASP